MVGWFVGRLIVRLSCRLDDGLVGCLIGCLVCCLVVVCSGLLDVRFVVCLIDWLVDGFIVGVECSIGQLIG